MAETKHYPSVFEDEYLDIKYGKATEIMSRVFFYMALGMSKEEAIKRVLDES